MDSDPPELFDGMNLNTGAISPETIPPTSQPASASAPAPATPSGTKRKQKKVRFACERCRYRRVKCDGQVPACGNCSKAKAQCIDVDSRDAEKRLVRGSSEQTASRITWLEDIIRIYLPHINLDDDPFPYSQADSFDETSENTIGSLDITSQNPSMDHMGYVQENAGSGNETSATGNYPDPARGKKRSLAAVKSGSTFREMSIDQEARSVALELGLLSLNSDTPQKHYLGSSSGSLFAPLFLTKKSGKTLVADAQSVGSSQDAYGRKETPQAKSGIPTTSHTLNIKNAPDALYEQLRKDLPPRDECSVLLDRFFSHMHPNHPFLHRPSFNCAVDALYECLAVSVKASSQHNGWPASVQSFSYNGEDYISQGLKIIPISAHVAAFQLLIALSVGATLQIRSRRYSHNPKVFFHSAISLSNCVFGSISLPSLQSILLVIVHSLVDPDGYDVWTLTHIAMAYAVDLGIHREVSGLGIFSSTATEMRRRVFFCVYTLDRSISTIQGRPLGLGDDTFDTHLPKMTDAQVQLVDSHSSSDDFDDVATISYSIQTFKIARLVSKIKSRFYPLRIHIDSQDFSQGCADAQSQLHAELEQWLEESTTTVSRTVPEDQRLRLTTKLQIQYHSAMCLLHQPSQAITQPDDDSLKICYTSASQRIHLFEVLYDSGALYHSWRTVQDMFLAGATIMYCVSISSVVRRSVSISSLSKDFRACSSMLSVGGEWWPTIRKAKYSLERLSNYILEILSENSHSDGADLRVGQQPFPQDYTPDMANWPGSETVRPRGLEQTFSTMVNRDGRLIDFFDETLTNVLMDGMPSKSQANGGFDTAFWDGFDQGGFHDGEWV